jgi:tetratricopeptide (TPR) repeat protein
LGAYHRAAEFDPADYRPLWNISAVHYELGSHDLASEYTERALDIVPENEEVASQKILHRLAKVHLHLKQYDEAAKYIIQINPGADEGQLEAALLTGKRTVSIQSKSVRDLPQYKPLATNVPEYYSVGHDLANSMFDPLLEEKSSDTETLAFLFAGIGDARHLLQTFVAVSQIESARPSHRKYHFTINDVKQEVFARDLVFFLLLDQLASELRRVDNVPAKLSQNGEKILATLFYAFISQVMSPVIYEHLQATIESAIQCLEDKECPESKQSLPSWLRLDKKDHDAMLAALKCWQTTLSRNIPQKPSSKTSLLDTKKPISR